MVLAAGYGTRLRPLTDELPKPLMPVANQPLLSLVLRYLCRWQPQRVVVNGHYRARQLHDFLLSSPRAENILFVHEQDILGTGGGIRNAAAWLDGELFVTVNSDVLTDLPLDLVIDFHREQPRDVLATMVFHDCSRFNSVQVAGQRVVSFDASHPAGKQGQRLAYTGIQVCSPRLFDFLTATSGFSSIIEVYERLLREKKGQVAACIIPAGRYYWRDVGTISDYLGVHLDLHNDAGLARLLLGDDTVFPLVASGSRVAGAALSGSTVVAPRCELAAGSQIEDSILWPGAVVGRNCHLQRCVVGKNVRIPAASVFIDRVLVENSISTF
jgi:NDP-sugar pyrophosphorylase family protein